jgi:hypothetical protein
VGRPALGMVGTPVTFPHLPTVIATQSTQNRRSLALSARVAVYAGPTDPPVLEEITESDAALLVERLYEAAARAARPPVIALREIIENLVHAGFRDALVSILDQGRVVRVSDSGPGIADPERAMEPGFTTAGPAEREVVRGAGCGLPLAAGVLHAEGGELLLTENIGGGTVVTLSVPAPDRAPEDPQVGDDARVLMALLLEVGPSRPETLAAELGWGIGRCGRELVLLEARGLVGRSAEGERSLTTAGSTLLATLF